MNNVLIVGSGGREHALAHKFCQSPQVSKVFVAPGNLGMKDVATLVNIQELDFKNLALFAKENNIALTFVGPEIPLVDGIVNYFQSQGLTIFGPNAIAAEIEGSKAFTKNLMKKYKIPTANYDIFNNLEEAVSYIDNYSGTLPIVIKADGLAAGKGVAIAQSKEEAIKSVKEIMQGKFGAAGNKIVIEEFLQGEEFSFMAFVNGETVVPMQLSRDHKQAYDGNEGPNTGGMGAYSPVIQIGEETTQMSVTEILQKTANAMVEESRPFVGILYAGLIKTQSGPKVIEFNARFGDPETEVILPRLENDLYQVIIDMLSNKKVTLNWSSNTAIGVVLTSGGYPSRFTTGHPITGLDNLLSDTIVYHSATTYQNDTTTTNGGRVLVIVRKEENLNTAKQKVYDEVKKIHWQGMHYRGDIGEIY